MLENCPYCYEESEERDRIMVVANVCRVGLLTVVPTVLVDSEQCWTDRDETGLETLSARFSKTGSGWVKKK